MKVIERYFSCYIRALIYCTKKDEVQGSTILLIYLHEYNFRLVGDEFFHDAWLDFSIFGWHEDTVSRFSGERRGWKGGSEIRMSEYDYCDSIER